MLKRTLIFILCILFAVPTLSYAEPSVGAKSAAVIEADSGKLVYGLNENERLPMASVTKIMTALLAIESGKYGMEITVTKEMCYVEGTSMGLQIGDKVKLRDLIYGMLLQSGNDAANATAIALGGSIPGFAKMMNDRAAQMGLKDTNFVTPSGLDDEHHYTSARDMAVLGVNAIKNPEFRDICSQKSAQVEFGNPVKKVTLYNHNKLLNQYDGCIGIKTGFTKKSGRCLVSAAERDGVTIVVATLSNYNYWEDHAKLLDYGLSHYVDMPLNGDFMNVRLKITGGVSSDVAVEPATTPKASLRGAEMGKIERKIYIKQFEYAPIEKGKVVGYAQYIYDGAVVEETQIVVSHSVDALPAPPKSEGIKGFFDRLFSKDVESGSK